MRVFRSAVCAVIAALAASVGGSASAIDIKVTGDFNHRIGIYTDQAPMYAASETIGSISQPGGANGIVQRFPVDESWAEIKYRLASQFATDDQKVKGILGFEWGAIRFGNAGTSGTGGSGGAFSGDGVNTELRLAYTDITLPTEFKSSVLFGLQPFAVNRFLWQETATAIQLKADPGPVALTLGWARGIEFFNSLRTDPLFKDADNLLLRADLGKQIPDLKLGAFALWQHRKPQAAGLQAVSHLLKRFGPVGYDINNFGVDGSYKAGMAFVNLNAIYQFGTISNTSGSALTTAANRASKSNLEQSGFLVHADLGVDLGPARITYSGRYASGDTNQKDGKINNFIATDVDINDSIVFNEGGITDDNYFTEAPYFLDKGTIFNKLAFEYKPDKKLTIGLAGLYVMLAEEVLLTGGTKSRNLGFEVDTSISYVLYDGLTLAANAGYLFAQDAMDFFEVVKNGQKDHDIFRATAGLRYRFGSGPI